MKLRNLFKRKPSKKDEELGRLIVQNHKIDDYLEQALEELGMEERPKDGTYLRELLIAELILELAARQNGKSYWGKS